MDSGGYEILADILRGKCQLINISSFEILFEFLGLNFRSPECVIHYQWYFVIRSFNYSSQSTIVNIPAYRALALDFELWSRTPKEIQRLYLEHFTTVLQTSRFKRFNIWQRFSKLGLVRKLLFVLQSDWFQQDMVPFVVDALRVAMQAQFTQDGTIKPIVSYLAANLHESLSTFSLSFASSLNLLQCKSAHALSPPTQ